MSQQISYKEGITEISDSVIARMQLQNHKCSGSFKKSACIPEVSSVQQ